MLEKDARASINLDLIAWQFRDIELVAHWVETGILLNRANVYARLCFQLFPPIPVSTAPHWVPRLWGFHSSSDLRASFQTRRFSWGETVRVAMSVQGQG